MALTLLLAMAGLLANPPSFMPGRVTCAGRVLTSGDAVPVAGARVEVTTAADAAARTDTEGRFQIPGLAPGRHTLLVAADG